MKRLIILTLLAICTTICYSQENNTALTVKKNNEQIKSFSTKFTELQYSRSSRQSFDMYGKLYFDAIGRLAMIYNDPEDDYIIIDGSTFSAKHNGKKNSFQADKQNTMSEFSDCMLHAMSGDIPTIEQTLGMDVRSKVDNQYYNFTLLRQNTKRLKKHQIKRLTLRYDKRTSALVYMTIEEASGNTTTYALQHPQINATIPDNVFIPKQ